MAAPRSPRTTGCASRAEAHGRSHRTFASWRQGATLDRVWLAPREGRTQAVIVSVAHLDDDERALVLSVLLVEVLSWVRTLRGSRRLRALLVAA